MRAFVRSQDLLHSPTKSDGGCLPLLDATVKCDLPGFTFGAYRKATHCGGYLDYEWVLSARAAVPCDVVVGSSRSDELALDDDVLWDCSSYDGRRTSEDDSSKDEETSAIRDGYAVSTDMIRMKAFNFVRHMGVPQAHSKASRGWATWFMNHRLRTVEFAATLAPSSGGDARVSGRWVHGAARFDVYFFP
ncbi:hypothetical protein HPB50_012241 [Hyalomma asiaticum]|uniref:Uncharacterized protein n=1 Tax=Hyalomma asiaticum TaxID=266040 RepID=A0ACB7RNA3_HYAAI|nr:hypothetical protein HPB50_012241 [Hyalomma asiaticum]